MLSNLRLTNFSNQDSLTSAKCRLNGQNIRPEIDLLPTCQPIQMQRQGSGQTKQNKRKNKKQKSSLTHCAGTFGYPRTKKEKEKNFVL